MSAFGSLWVELGPAEAIPLRGARVVRTTQGDIALFRTGDGAVFALEDRCPHRGGPLSQGIVHDRGVTCPLHNWVISLETGEVKGPDQGCVKTLPIRVQDGRVYLSAAALAPFTA
jgi:nitrite reductase [NAD(P)H] small subunit